MITNEDVYENVIDWVQQEFDICFAIRVEEISWRLWREIRKSSSDLPESDVESAARAIMEQLEPPPPKTRAEAPWGKESTDHYGLICKAYTDAMQRYVVDAVYAGLGLPTFRAPDRSILPKPDLFLFTKVGTIWTECETLSGEVSKQVTILYRKLDIARKYAEYYDRYIFVVPQKAHSYRTADIARLIGAKTAEELRINVLYL